MQKISKLEAFRRAKLQASHEKKARAARKRLDGYNRALNARWDEAAKRAKRDAFRRLPLYEQMVYEEPAD